jgi:hypothetical protein
MWASLLQTRPRKLTPLQMCPLVVMRLRDHHVVPVKLHEQLMPKKTKMQPRMLQLCCLFQPHLLGFLTDFLISLTFWRPWTCVVGP